ncbi:MAG: hypothetical protein JXR07_19350 [Reichenbachiella sp.]
MRRNKQFYIRKIHRFLGVTIGVQFLFWTISGLFFSWTDLDEIHGDHFLKSPNKYQVSNLMPIQVVLKNKPVNNLELIFIGDQPYYWVNDQLYHAMTGQFKSQISREDAIQVANDHVKDEYEVKNLRLLDEVGSHHEYRGRPLPVWELSYENPTHLKAYVSAQDGKFQRVRHRSWRWFDFLWMSHTMDYEGRDNINNLLLRIFSILGLLTVTSGFVLFFVSSKSYNKRKRI